MSDQPKQLRGLARLSPERRREVARMGGKSVPAEKRSFSVQRDLAVAAGKKGGKATSAEKRTFKTKPGLAKAARKRQTIQKDSIV